MTPRAPRLTAREIIAALEKSGFSLARQSGSHMIYKNSFGKRVTIPISRQQDPSPEDSHEYPSDAELSIEKLQELL